MSTRFSQYLNVETLAWLVDELEGYANYIWNTHVTHEHFDHAAYVMKDLVQLRVMNADVKAGYGLYVREFEMLDDCCERYGYGHILEEVQ